MTDTSQTPKEFEARWRELCEHIRTTDEISFKLLGFVPLVSVAGISVAVLKAEAKFTPALVFLSLFAAAVTLALWIWERRNIQTCKWLRYRAAELEGPLVGKGKSGHFSQFPQAHFLAGKTEGEKYVYGLTIAAWLLLPWILFASAPAGTVSTGDRNLMNVHWYIAGALALLAVVALCLPVNAGSSPKGRTL